MPRESRSKVESQASVRRQTKIVGLGPLQGVSLSIANLVRSRRSEVRLVEQPRVEGSEALYFRALNWDSVVHGDQ